MPSNWYCLRCKVLRDGDFVIKYTARPVTATSKLPTAIDMNNFEEARIVFLYR